MEELKGTIEIICNDKTYVSKKMNPTRRALIIQNIIGQMGSSEVQNNADAGITVMGKLFEKYLPETMWEFIKDDDKKIIGTYELFIEELDDKSCLLFLEWSMSKVNEVNDFLVKSKKAAQK